MQHARSIGVRTTAKTAAGLVCAWKAYRAKNPLRSNLRVFRQNAYPQHLRPDILAHKKKMQDKKDMAEAKRASADPKFREELIVSMRGAWRALNVRPRTAMQFAKWVEGAKQRTDLQERVRKLQAQGVSIKLPPQKDFGSMARVWYLWDASEVRKRIGGRALDRCTWTYEPCFVASHIKAHTWHRSVRTGRGRFRTVQKSNHIIAYQSFFFIPTSGKHVDLVHPVHKAVRIQALSGYKWGRDSLGLKLVRLSDGRDYHLATYKSHEHPPFTAESCVQALADLDASRDAEERAHAARQALEQAFVRDLRTTRVSLIDSQRAGNCIHGSMQFGKRMGFDEAQYNGLNAPGISAAVLHRTGDARAIRACWRAWERETLVSI